MTRICAIFLDFDGVLNSHAWLLSKKPEERGGVIGLDPAAIGRLNRLLSYPDVAVVVSSTWRFDRSVAQLRAVLEEGGFVGDVLGRTPRWVGTTSGGLYTAKSRGEEIQAWLDLAPDYGITVESFVIIDDDADMDHLTDRLVQTTFATGLQDEHVDRAIALLRQPPPLLVIPTAADVARLGEPQ